MSQAAPHSGSAGNAQVAVPKDSNPLSKRLKCRALGYRQRFQRSSKHSNSKDCGDLHLTHSHIKSSKPDDSSTSQKPQDLRPTAAEYSTSGSTITTQRIPSVPSELPLKRPRELEVSSGPTEEPLSRPSNSEEGIAFSDIVATFAVDVSGSTRGSVLEEEKQAISLICSGLSRNSQTQTQIIPWSHAASRVCRSSELDTLHSSGGTVPNCLNTEPHSRSALSECSAWFLLTDGQIAHNDLLEFSKGVCEASLHGTPCVVILFGHKTFRPANANISVGLSVFAHTTDCLFLFHDIDSTQVYILQSKGRYNKLLAPGCHELVLE